MAPLQVLVVSSDASVRERLRAVLCREAVSAAWVQSGQQCLAALERAPWQALFLDIETEGVQDELVRQAVSIQPRLVVAVLADRAAMNVARLRICAAHTEFVALPLADGAVQAVLQRAAGAQARRGGNGAGPGSAAGTPRQAGHDAEHGRGAPAPDAADDWNEAFAQLVACSPAMRAVVELAGRVAATDAAVLIQGETGTGKALLAYQIHRRSRRAGGPFVRVACGALRENEADEMLFGRPATPFVPQGAPAGAAGNGGGHPMSETPPGPLGQMRSPACPPASSAASAPPGLLASARGGTLYLQNVERLPFSTQVKLCDALQGGDYDWPSMPDAGRADVRVVASTRQDLKAAVAENRFYSGLYYLLDVMPIAVPPLRERREDIRRLAEYFLAAVSRAWGLGNPPPQFNEQAWECLLESAWPGNARQLAGVVARAVIRGGGGQIPRECVTELLRPGAAPHGASDTLSLPMVGGLRTMERWIIEEVIRRCHGNKAAAARTLGLHRRTLYRMLEDGGPLLEAPPATAIAPGIVAVASH
ncbi:MAG: sigma 54-interacting transcriptional regulator [Thermoguttaceae bacterium]|jgi:DNA-binding NtrC family response regulator